MALSARLSGMRNPTDLPRDQLWSIEPVWWPEWEVIKEARLDHVGARPSEMDYERIMSREEALELHRRYPLNDPTDWLGDRAREMEGRLSDPDDAPFVRVEVFEWGSGMG
jgi:hypothetical protein